MLLDVCVVWWCFACVRLTRGPHAPARRAWPPAATAGPLLPSLHAVHATSRSQLRFHTVTMSAKWVKQPKLAFTLPCAPSHDAAGVDTQHARMDELHHQLELLTLESASKQHAQHAQQAQQVAEPAPTVAPPPGLAMAPEAAAPAAPAAPVLAPVATPPGSGSSIDLVLRTQCGESPAALYSLQRLREAMEPEVAEEAARLAEIERKAAADAAAAAAAKEERKAAKRAAATAAREAKAEERRRARAERGRSRSRSRASRTGRSRSRRSATGSSPAALSPLRAAQSAAAAAVSNLGAASHLTAPLNHTTSNAAAAVDAAAAVAVEPAVLAAQLLPSVAAGSAQPAVPGKVVAAADFDGPSREVEGATEPAVPQAAGFAATADKATAGQEATAGPEGSEQAAGSSLEGGDKRKERRHGKNMKAAFKDRRQRRAAGGDAGPTAAGAPPSGLAAPVQQQTQQPPGAAAEAPQRPDAGQEPARHITDARRRQHRTHGRGDRDGGQQQRREAAEGFGGLARSSPGPTGGQPSRAPVVLRVLRRQVGRGPGGSSSAQAPPAPAPAVTSPA